MSRQDTVGPGAGRSFTFDRPAAIARGSVARVGALELIGFFWTLPNTVLGLVLGLLTFQVPRAHGGAIVFDRTPRGLTRLLGTMHRTAMTVGFVIVAAVPIEGRLQLHERHHIRQYMMWGPFFIPVYLVLAIPFGYRRHPMERAARRAAGEED
jgi:hypothetical protein